MTEIKKNIRDRIKTVLLEEEEKIKSSFEGEGRFALIDIFRFIDFHQIISISVSPRSLENGFHENTSLIYYGLHKVLSIFVDSSTKNSGAPLFTSDNESQSWANSVLQVCGRIGYCENLLEAYRLDLMEIIETQTNSYYVYPKAEFAGAESYEVKNIDWTKKLISKSDSDIAKQLEIQQEIIGKKMSAKVNKWMEHYIQYKPSPEIDAHFIKKSILRCRKMLGQDSFPKNAKFGDYEFDLYCSAVGIFVSWSLKHIAFCFELIKKHPDIYLPNILTITTPEESLIESLSSALKIDSNAATQLIEILTLTNGNKDAHCSVAGNLISPMFVEVGASNMLRPLWGSFGEPFLFMLRELKRRYQTDWDKAVFTREEIFRNDIYNLFPSDRFYKLSENKNLKLNGSILTDIDALIYDYQTGCLGIFQLKWQDFFGNSLQERESKKKNILHTGNRWIEQVSLWLASVGTETRARTFGLSRQENHNIKEIKMFMIGRNSAFFSGYGEPDTRAAWGSWYQILRFIVKAHESKNPLKTLFNRLNRDSPHKKPKLLVSPQEIKIGNLKIIFGDEI